MVLEGIPEVVDEAALTERARRGDAAAFGELVKRYMRRAYHVALGLVGSPEDALDLSQDAFVRAFGARRSLEAGRPFYPWYYQILRRLCFNFTRDRGLHRRKLLAEKNWIVDDASYRAEQKNPHRVAERRELRRRVREAIETLPQREREVLVLKEFEDMKYREIAEVVGVPIGTVMSRLYSARRHLAAAIEETP